MTAEVTPTDETELATQLRTRGLVSTVAKQECWRRDDTALLETVAALLNAPDAPQIDLHLEEALVCGKFRGFGQRRAAPNSDNMVYCRLAVWGREA